MVTYISTLARRFGRFWFCIAAGVSIGSGLSLNVMGQVQSDARSLLERSWTPGGENRPQTISALLQTRQGYLWIGTDKGLVRFDGVRFTDFPFATTPGMSQSATVFSALWEDAKGGIWAGTYAGVTHYDGQRFSRLTKQDGLPDDSVLRIDGDATGAVWIFTRDGVARWKGGSLEVVHPEREGGAPGPLITAFPSDGDDLAHLGLWRHRGRFGLERFAYGQWSEFPLPYAGKREESSQIRSVYEDSLRRVWFSLLFEPTQYHEVTPTGALVNYRGLPAQAFVFFCDRDGFLWISDHQSHTARWKDGALYPVPLLRTPYLTRVIERPDGELWAGTYYTKLFLFRPQVISKIRTPGAGEVGPVLLRRRDGTVWAASTDLVRFEGDKAVPIAALGGSTAFGVATALGEDSHGDLLLGERWRTGLFTLKGREIVRSPRYAAVQGSVRAILTDSGGDEWFGTTAGLFHEHAGAIHRVASDLPGTQVTCLLESAPGQLWVGTDQGVAIVLGEKAKRFPADETRTPWSVSSLAKDSDGSIWISTVDAGIVHFVSGTFRSFGQRDGLPTDVIYSVDASDANYIWLRTDSGLLRLDRADLSSQPLTISVTQFDEADGLPMNEMTPASAQETLHFPDGTIWFSTQGGIASMHPGAQDETRSQALAVIEEHLIDSSSLLPSLPGGIVLMPKETNLEIRYTVLGSFRPERVKFRYQLSGIDTDWVTAGERRAAFYSHLPPGQYVFRVQAAEGNESGWNEPEARILVAVRTPFYKTWWMKTLLLVLVISAIVIVMEVRRRHLLEIQRTRQAFTHRLIASQEAERKRIAHELHDGLGQHLALIRTLALLPGKLRTTRATDPEASGVESLSTIAEQAATAIREVETICYDLRPYQLDRLGLTKAVRSLLRTLEDGNTLLVRGSVEDIDGFFPRELEITFYRILQEGISNILKHSAATEAVIGVVSDGTKLRLTIQDNGHGFSVPSREASVESLGLIGITERAEALGGTSTIESSEAGTRVVVEVIRNATNGTGVQRH